MSGKKSMRPIGGALSTRFSTPSKVSKAHLQGKLTSPLTRQFKSPVSRNASASSAQLTSPTVDASLTPEHLASLQGKVAQIDAEIQELHDLGCKESELQTHIDKLHEYNEIKDVAQMVIGRLAVLEGVQTKDLYPRYDLELTD